MKHKLLLVVAVALLLFSAGIAPPPTPSAQAQGGGILTYGALAFGSISSQTPVQLYSFNGTQGDLIEVHLHATSNGLRPFVDLLAPDRQTIATGQQDSFAANTGDVQIVLLLPQTGVYSLMLGGADNTTGDYVLELNGRSATNRVPLTFGQALPVNVPLDAAPQYFTFTTESCPTTLSVLSPSQGTPYTFPFIVKVRDARGQIVSVLRGGDAFEDRVTVAPQSGDYEVEVWVADPTLTGTLTLLVSCAGEPQQCLSSDSTAGDGTSAGDSAAECAECPACPGDETDNPVCAEFSISVDRNAEGVVTISWPAVEGADSAIVSAHDEAGELVYARMIVGAFTDTIEFPLWSSGPGTFTIRVSVGSEGAGYNLCVRTIAVEVSGGGPVPWGPAAGDDDDSVCQITIIAPLHTIANGLQTFFWSEVPGADSYRLRVYGQFDVARADGVISAPATSMTLDVSEAAIGVGYGGGNEFYVQINAYRGGDSWCSSGVRVTRVR